MLNVKENCKVRLQKFKEENKDLKQIISLKEDIELVEQNHASDSDVNEANSWKTIIDSRKRIVVNVILKVTRNCH
jgi:hypothetical protein